MTFVLHWLKISERIEYKLLSLTYKALTTAEPTYLHSLITVQPPRGTRPSSVVTLSRPPTASSLKITNRSFRYASSHLWNSCLLTTLTLHHTLTISFQTQNSTLPQIYSTIV